MPGEMDVSVPAGVLESLRKLRVELLVEAQALVVRRSGLLKELQAVGKIIESRRRMLELVEATERQLAAQQRGRRAIEGGGPGAGTQVRAWASCRISGHVAHLGLVVSVATAHASGCPQAPPAHVAWSQAAASAHLYDGPP
jgi:hypothetical protein